MCAVRALGFSDNGRSWLVLCIFCSAHAKKGAKASATGGGYAELGTQARYISTTLLRLAGLHPSHGIGCVVGITASSCCFFGGFVGFSSFFLSVLMIRSSDKRQCAEVSRPVGGGLMRGGGHGGGHFEFCVVRGSRAKNGRKNDRELGVLLSTAHITGGRPVHSRTAEFTETPPCVCIFCFAPFLIEAEIGSSRFALRLYRHISDHPE
jgi:hypothetical protein